MFRRTPRRAAIAAVANATARSQLYTCEPLEVRLALSGYLLIDYGDNFPVVGSGRTLSTTIQGLRDIADSGVPNDKILGTTLTDSVGQAPTLTTSLTFNAAARTITRAAGNFVTNGFVNNHQITISGTASNNGNYVISNVTNTVLTLAPGPAVTDEGPANATIGPRIDTPVTITRPGFSAAERAKILAVVTRAYRPLDLTVVELTPTGQLLADGRTVTAATSIGDIVNNLRGGNGAFRDAYVIAASFLVSPGGPNQNNPGSTNGGNSPSSPTLGVMSDLATGQNNHDDVALVFAGGAGGNFTNTMNNIAHEAGHLLGMRHSITDTGTNATTLQLHQAEIMSYQNTNNTSSSMFTRYPMVRGDDNTPVFNGSVTFNAAARTLTSNSGNFPANFSAGQQIQVSGTASNNNTYTVQTLVNNVITLTVGSPALTNGTDATTTIRLPNPFNYNDLGPRNTPAGQPTYHNQLANDANVRANQTLTFVSGTGQNDIITIAKNGANADVTVQAFSSANYAGGTGITVPGSASTSYTYQIPLTQPILVYGGDGADRFVLDADLGVGIEIDGMLGVDTLNINGKNAAAMTYTPDATAPNGVDMIIGPMTNVQSFGGTLLSGATSITFRDFETTSSLNIQDVTALTLRTGGSDDDLTLSAPTAGQMRVGGTSDAISIVPMLFTSVTGLTLDTGTNDGANAGDEVLFAASSIATGLNTIAVNTGIGGDELDVNFAVGNPIPAGGVSYNAGAAADPNDLLTLRGGSFATEVYTPTGAHSGSIVFDGSSTLTYSNLAPINDTAGAGSVTFNGSAIADTINLVDGDIIDGFDTNQINSASFELVNFANKGTVHVAGQNGGDTINVDLSDPADGLNALNVYGEDAAAAGDDNASDTINVIPRANALPITALGNGGTGDILNVDGSAGSFELTNTTVTSPGLQTITYATVERLELLNGTFNIATAVNVTTPIHVNLAATLTGTGTASGGIAANNGGTVSPGVLAPGTLGSGNLAFNAGSTYTLDLNGTGAGTHDELNVTGSVNLDNTAALAATVGFLSIPGDEIVIIRNDGLDAVVGQFAGGLILNFGGVKFTIDYAYDADGDNAFNDVALVRYGAQLAPDPCDPDEMALFVSASSGADDVRVVPATGNSRGQALINGVDEGTFAFKGHIYIMGQNGDDTVAVTMPSRTAFLYGNAGNDLLLSSNADSVLIGGFGSDTARSGNGKDVLVGGAGADVLEGGNGADILIAGATTYDAVSAANRVALCEILDLWQHGHKPGELFGLLNAGTLVADADVDQLFGQGGKDAFWLHLSGGANDAHDADKQEFLANV